MHSQWSQLLPTAPYPAIKLICIRRSMIQRTLRHGAFYKKKSLQFKNSSTSHPARTLLCTISDVSLELTAQQQHTDAVMLCKKFFDVHASILYRAVFSSPCMEAFVSETRIRCLLCTVRLEWKNLSVTDHCRKEVWAVCSLDCGGELFASLRLFHYLTYATRIDSI